MKLRIKLLVIVLFVGLVPITVSAWTTLQIHRRAQERAVAESLLATASHFAERANSHFAALRDGIRRLGSESIQWDALTAHERQAALWLVYRENPDIVAVALVTQSLDLVSEPAYLTEEDAQEDPQRLLGSPRLVSTLLQSLPAPRARRVGDVSFGDPFTDAATPIPLLPLVLTIPGELREENLLLAIAVSLRSLCRADAHRDGAPRILLFDRQLRHACPLQGGLALAPADQGLSALLKAPHAERSYLDDAGLLQLISLRQLDRGWWVAARQSRDLAYAAGMSIARQALLWITISVVIALASGWLLARGILVPVRRLLAGAAALGRGDLNYRLEMPERDELGELGRAFNHMAMELKSRDQEIRTFNEELQQRVKERTRAIEVYHQRVLHMEKSGIMANLSAGVASQINDPLTGVLGALQLLVTRTRQEPGRAQEARLLSNAEAGAQEIRRLVRRMQDLSQRQPRSQLRPVRVRDLITSALNSLRHELELARIEVVQSYEPRLADVAGNFTQLEQALVQVISNAITACSLAVSSSSAPSSGRGEPTSEAGASIAVRLEDGSGGNDDPPAAPPSGSAGPPEEARGPLPRLIVMARSGPLHMVEIVVRDNGIGLQEEDLERIFEPFVTLGEKTGTGLGLTVARHVFEEHGGTIRATRNKGSGATFHIHLPESSSP